MPLEEYLKDQPLAKKSGSKKTDTSNVGKSMDEDTASIPDRQKIALLKKILQEKNVDVTPSRATPRPSQKKSSTQEHEQGDFLAALERFAEWIRGRTYLRGDIDTAKQMIANLVVLDPMLLPPSATDKISEHIPDLAEFLRGAKEHDSLHPDSPILTKQEYAALMKKKKETHLTSTDYRYLKFLKEKVKDFVKKYPFYAFLVSYLDMHNI